MPRKYVSFHNWEQTFYNEILNVFQTVLIVACRYIINNKIIYMQTSPFYSNNNFYII